MTLARAFAFLIGLAILVPPAWADVQLMPKFQEGSTYKTKDTVKTRQSLKLAGQNLETQADTVLISQHTVGQRNAQGDLPIDVTYTEVVTALTLPGNKKVTYNSTTGEGKTDDPNFQIILDRVQALKGMTFSIVLDKDNRVKSVVGLKPESGASAEDIKTSLQQALDRYPRETVQPGDQWEREVALPLGEGQIFTLQRKYKYVGPEVRSTVASTRQLEKVTATTERLTYSIRPNSGIPGTVTKSDLKVDSAEATLLFDPAIGRTVSLLDKMHVTGTLTLDIMNIELGGELDLTMEMRTEEIE